MAKAFLFTFLCSPELWHLLQKRTTTTSESHKWQLSGGLENNAWPFGCQDTDPRMAVVLWPWVKSQIAPPVNIPIHTKIPTIMGGEFTSPNMGSQNGFDNHRPFGLGRYPKRNSQLEGQLEVTPLPPTSKALKAAVTVPWVLQKGNGGTSNHTTWSPVCFFLWGEGGYLYFWLTLSCLLFFLGGPLLLVDFVVPPPMPELVGGRL